MFERFTQKFVKKYENLGGHILTAFEEYIKDVRTETFLSEQHIFHIKKMNSISFETSELGDDTILTNIF